MSSFSVSYLFSKYCFPVAVLFAVILLILDAGAPPVVGQARTVTVTVYVPTVRTIYVPTVQTIYLPEYRTILQTVTVPATSLLTDRITFTVTQFETKVVELNKPMRPLETLNTQIWEDFDKEPLLLGGVIGALAGAVATNHYHRRKHRK